MTTPQKRTPAGPHRRALNAAIRAAGAKLGPEDKPLLELCKTLADQVDAEGAAASTRLTAAYLSALKDLRRALDAAKSAPKPGRGKTQLQILREQRQAEGRAS